jgi:hypothetical protein
MRLCMPYIERWKPRRATVAGGALNDQVSTV